jgi:DNA-binding XRE family transcriptional regulator
MSMMKMTRQMKGLTQDQISILADVPQPILSKIERGVIKPTPSIQEAQKRIAMALECSIEVLFPDQKDRP